MSEVQAIIPNCIQPTPISVLDIIPKATMPCLVGVLTHHEQTESYKQSVKELHVCLKSLLAIPNTMEWDVAPLIRRAMADTCIFLAVDWSNEERYIKKKQQMEDSIDLLHKFCKKSEQS